jgi:phosphatidylinositol alpha-1,6-mannosyltransferase
MKTANETTAPRIIGLFPELLAVGGVQQAGRLTAAALQDIAARNEWATDILSLNDSPSQKVLRMESREIPIRGFGRAKVKLVLEATKRSKKNAQIILAGHPNLAVPSILLQGATPAIKTVVIAHGVEVWSPLPTLKRAALLRADLVLAPSRYTMEKLVEEQGVSPTKVRQLAWPLDPSFLRLAESMPPPLSGFPKGRTILTVGRWASTERYKGCDTLIDALAQLRETFADLTLVAVGSGDDLPRLRKRAGELSVADHVHFFENLSQQELASCYAHADIFALPSFGEGFGLVFLEAMAFAKPVVGAAIGGPIDLIVNGMNGFLVHPHDFGELSEALHRLLSDANLRAEMGHRGSETVRERYSFAVFRTVLESLLAECGLHDRNLISAMNVIAS